MPSLRVLSWALLGVAAVVSLVAVPAPTLLARLFFVLVVLTGLVAGAGLVGPRVQLVTAAAILLLSGAERLPIRPLHDPPLGQWTVELTSTTQVVEHTLQLPVTSPQWARLWQEAASAHVYLCAQGTVYPEQDLLVEANGEPLGTVGPGEIYGPPRGDTTLGFYRLPVSREFLEAHQPLTVRIRRTSARDDRPVALCGTFSYRPTASPLSSVLRDGGVPWFPWQDRQGRFIVEVRLEAADGRILAAWY